ncbi:MAG TPA: 2-succinyl-5-enolpyruvyl-6-hydroxy-3-cyclohexene-1-carboxylic-acid synthase, partial [Conexibacter sp.]|nr:2-succinyl-5-enolpyruvyl-6-hydroxy-3-cyclohexene-1-carboxylic-acid synthase [Conexibacter sp.]
VIEAQQARVPMIVLTADRPPELRDVGAGQTIDQIKLFGGAAKQFFEVGVVGEATPAALRWMRTLACRAVRTALDGRPGVVHLNLPLREPLIMSEPLPAKDPLPGRADGRPWVARPAPISAGPGVAEPPGPAVISLPAGRGVVVAGRTEREGGGAAAAALAERLGWVLLADPLSGARRGPNAIACYDALLRDPGFVARIGAPAAVVRIGDVPTSKPLRGWLAGLDPAIRQLAIDPEGTWHDPDGVVSERAAVGLDALVAEGVGEADGAAGAAGAAGAGDPAWLAQWRDADAAAARAIAETIGAGPDAPLNEPLIAAELTAALPAATTLFVAASMPIRDVETFAPARDDGPLTLSNRGANGIDGIVASALGAAAAGSGPVVLHIGDVALAYDLSALLSARRLALDLTIVLVNNDGGGIFHFLPVATQADHFEHHVATPHGLDFAVAAQLYGARHLPVATAGDLRAAVAQATAPGAGVTIVEARTERDANVALHRRVWDAVGAALGTS